MRIIIRPYKPSSRSAKLLAEAVGGKRIYYGHKFKPHQSDVVVNWGGSDNVPWWPFSKVLNNPAHTHHAANKKTAFTEMWEKEVPTPEFTPFKEIAKTWLDAGKIVVVRHKLTANQGKGIQLLKPSDEIPNAPLYTLYKKKKKEFRVHVFNGKVIDVQQKKRRNGQEADQYIRNIGAGWVFCREGIVEPSSLREVSINAVKALGLDFGAVDVIWNQLEDKCYVLEVNTAPGIEGSTVNSYANAIKEYVQNV